MSKITMKLLGSRQAEIPNVDEQSKQQPRIYFSKNNKLSQHTSPQYSKIHFFRPYLLTLPSIPIAVSYAYALHIGRTVSSIYVLLLLICSIFGFFGALILNEYNDFFNGINRDDLPGNGTILVKRTFPPRQLLKLSFLCYFIGFLASIPIIYVYKFPAAVFLIICFIASVSYSSKPLAYKYIAYSDFASFLFFGPVLFTGALYTISGTFDGEIITLSLPFAFMSMSVVHSNNICNHSVNYENYETTVAMILGPKRSLTLFYFLLTVPFFLIAVSIARNKLSPTFLSLTILLPLMLYIAKSASAIDSNEHKKFSRIVKLNALYHCLFGILFSVSFLWG